MVILHRLKGAEFVLNADLIETIEANPDTVITLTNDKKYIVQETVSTVMDLVLSYKSRIHSNPKIQMSKDGN
ncbi:endoflagellar protein [Leptospira ryugenii]|uniref:Endoflagellar protein n=1 Tax=Leptospira ryugenii TaxID=1917863 RepID=A0A2P2E2W4_9LEPT|nr:flagellar FlbD family protein [Leptospira ryugenii]GBF51156.1 endoflagellar protein [Leptospira ryugenii]